MQRADYGLAPVKRWVIRQAIAALVGLGAATSAQAALVPNLIPFYENNVGTAIREDTGLNHYSGRDLYAYSVDIAPVQLSLGKTYVISIANDFPDGTYSDRWAWAETGAVGLLMWAKNNGGAPEFWRVAGGAMAFALGDRSSVVFDAGLPSLDIPYLISDFRQEIGREFSLTSAAATFDSIRWWGVYGDPTGVPPTIGDDFTIRLYELIEPVLEPVPEPATLALIGVALAGAVTTRRRKPTSATC